MSKLNRIEVQSQQQLARNGPARNVVLNLFGGAWAGLLILLATPWYVHKLGLDGYGIVGLWLMMQVMMGLLDMGIGATLIRGFASARPDRGDLQLKRNLLRTLEVVYWSIAVMLSLALVLAAGWIGGHWLRADALPGGTIDTVLRLMAITLGLQFPCALYSNGLNGLHAHARMNAMQIVGNTLRYGVGAGVLFWRADLVWFFGAQIAVAAVQTLATRAAVWRLIYEPGSPRPRFRLDVLRQVRRFSIGMALSAVWAVLLANADRIVLSKLASTEELGKYAVAFAGAGLLQLGIQPFYRTYFPRYVELVSLADAARLRSEYFQSCRVMALVLVPLGALGFVFAPELLQIWLSKNDETIIRTFRLLLIGITCSGLMWLPAAFQQAHGWTRLHSSMMAGSLLVGAPIIVLSIPQFGSAAATGVWLLHGLSGITLGLWLMHRRLLVGDLLHWYRSVLALPMFTVLPLTALSAWLMPKGQGWAVDVVWIVLTAILSAALPLWHYLRREPGSLRPK
jgi:O-antigen/teichoic acid export membrane protein